MSNGVYGRVFALGVVSGLRSATPIALVRMGARNASSIAFTAAALGELIADKLPFTPSRTSLPALGARLASGAYAAGAVAKEDEANVAIAIALGVAGALAGTYGGYNVRKWLTTKVHIPDLIVALVEDTVAIGVGLAVR